MKTLYLSLKRHSTAPSCLERRLRPDRVTHNPGENIVLFVPSIKLRDTRIDRVQGLDRTKLETGIFSAGVDDGGRSEKERICLEETDGSLMTRDNHSSNSD